MDAVSVSPHLVRRNAPSDDVPCSRRVSDLPGAGFQKLTLPGTFHVQDIST
jgi:hypothetical protein